MRGTTMTKLGPILILLLLAAPIAAAAPEAAALPDAELPEETPAWAEAASAVGDGVAAGGQVAADVAGAIGSGALAAAAKAGALFAAGAAAIGAMLATLGGLALAGIIAFGEGLVAAGKLLGRFLAFLGASLWGLASTAFALLATGALGGYEIARAHPRETAIAAGAATGAGGLAWLLKRFGFLGLLPLYSRLAPSQMLENDARAAIFEHVKQNPGAHPSAIAETLHLGWGTVVYHLARLESSKLVSIRQVNHRKCYFAVDGTLDAQERHAIAAISTDKARAIVQVVRDAPGLTQKSLAERLGMSQALASWHVKRLVADGVLVTAREGRSNTLRVAEHVPVVAPSGAPVAIPA